MQADTDTCTYKLTACDLDKLTSYMYWILDGLTYSSPPDRAYMYLLVKSRSFDIHVIAKNPLHMYMYLVRPFTHGHGQPLISNIKHLGISVYVSLWQHI